MATARVPPNYRRWAEELLGAPPPEEPLSTCQDCPLVKEGDASGRHFDPMSKCCTYFPYLANFIVGGILTDESPEGTRARGIFEDLVGSGRMVLAPFGAGPPSVYNARYEQIAANFGHEITLRCPFYLHEEGGACGIWMHRNARCATWFCRHTAGSRSVIFWKYMDQLLTSVENLVARWCVAELNQDEGALFDAFPPHMSTPRESSRVWGEWAGREREFYVECARRVHLLGWDDIRVMGGFDLELLSRLVRRALANIQSPSLPARFRLGRLKGATIVRPGVQRLWGHSPFHPLDVSDDCIQTLQQATPPSGDAPVADLVAPDGSPLDPVRVRELLDFGIIESVDDEKILQK